MEIRDLERSTVNLEPENVFMESETVLVQYIISNWSLNLRNLSIFTSFSSVTKGLIFFLLFKVTQVMESN